jgi:hypothetical protein
VPNATLRLAADHPVLQFPNGTTLEGLGGDGQVRQRTAAPGRLRSASLPAEIDSDPAFDRVLSDFGIAEQETLEVEAPRLTTARDDAVVIEPHQDPGDQRQRVILYQDESGGLSWHFSADVRQVGAPARPRLRGAGGGARFVVPLRSAAARQALASCPPRRNLRGPITKAGRKLFKILVLPVASALLASPARWFAEAVEARYRPQRIWRITPENYRSGPADDTVDWASLRGGPVLLLIHGLFSSVEGMLSGLAPEVLARWCDRYGGRVIAFNHPTVSVGPDVNAAAFLQAAARSLQGERLELDVVAHSRGGIVARALCENADTIAGNGPCAVRSVYFVAVPNAGSPLGDAGRLPDLVDTITNCVANLPDGALAYSMETIVGLVMLMGQVASTALPGIVALSTREGFVVDRLNRSGRRSPAIYGAAAADFAPRPGSENGWFLGRLGSAAVRPAFESNGRPIANDLVVPFQSVYSNNGHPAFPIANTLCYEPSDGVWHSGFFAQSRTIAHIEKFWAGRGGVDLGEVMAIGPAALSPARRGTLRTGTPRNGQVGRGIPEIKEIKELKGLRTLRGRIDAGMLDDAPEVDVVRPAAERPPLEREPSLTFPDTMEAGQAADLSLLLMPPGDSTVSGNLLRLDPGADGEIQLVAELSAPGFRVEGPRHLKVTLRRERDPALERGSFRLTALDPGDGPIERALDVTFWRGNDCVGGVSRRTLVVPAGAAFRGRAQTEIVSPLRVSSRQRDQADLVLYVRQPDPAKSLFEISLRSTVFGEEYESRPFGTFDLGGRELGAYLSEALDPSFERFPPSELDDAAFEKALTAWNQRFVGVLTDLGSQLWAHLPQAFRDEYLRLAGLASPPRSLFVFSDELGFPWEIVRPSGRIDGRFVDLPPLGVQHVLGRWRPGIAARPQPQSLAVRQAALVVPDADSAGLPYAGQELSALSRLLPNARALRPAGRADVDRLLKSTDVQLVHFSGHGVVGANADLTALELEAGDSISSMAFASTALADQARPVLYLNACSVGRAGQVLARAGGFAGNCIASGWSGVIAPYWPVYDPSAANFSVAFYRKLLSGRAIGEALQELRAESPDDPTAQSYAYFGDPYARLALGPPSAALGAGA